MEARRERLIDLLAAGASSRPALVTAETGEVATYDDLQRTVISLAGKLSALGLGRGGRVALVNPEGPDFICLLLAVATMGATAAPLNPAYKRDEYAFYLSDLEPDLLLLPTGSIRAAREAAANGIRIIDVVSGGVSGPALTANGRTVEREAAFEDADPDDVALLLHTSGTTSRPKQVPLLQRNLMSSARTIAACYALGDGDVSYSAMPLFHVHGLVASTFAALVGAGSVITPRRFSPRAFWAQSRRYGVTWFSAAPTLLQMMLERIDRDGPPNTLRLARSCSSALSPALLQQAEEVLQVPVLEAYGMTEASHQISSDPLPPARRAAGSVGVPTGTEIRIVDAAGNFLLDGEIGEVAIRGPGVTPGYLGNPEANAAAFFEGWFPTRDRGVLENGYLRLEDRLKELIIRGGENISPAEVEEVLKAHPAVADAACFGVPDEKYGEQVEAAAALSGNADERALIEHCRERLTGVKVPTRLFLVPEVPRTPAGKLQRRRIAETLLDEKP